MCSAAGSSDGSWALIVLIIHRNMQATAAGDMLLFSGEWTMLTTVVPLFESLCWILVESPFQEMVEKHSTLQRLLLGLSYVKAHTPFCASEVP